MFIPGSHKQGMIDVPSNTQEEGRLAGVSAKRQYTVPNEQVAELEQKHGLVAPKGPKGSVLFFHPNIVHGSVSNISPRARRIVIITYNATTNAARASNRPEFLISRNNEALTHLRSSNGAPSP
jgi:ectoine hydroxylase